jgi:hypothetical protein
MKTVFLLIFALQGDSKLNGMSLIYPKHTSLASRLHCTPIPDIIIPEPDEAIDVEAWKKRNKGSKGKDDIKNSHSSSASESPIKGKNSSSTKSGSGSGSGSSGRGNFSPKSSKDSQNSSTKNKEEGKCKETAKDKEKEREAEKGKGKGKEKKSKKPKRKPSAAGIGAGLPGGWKLSDDEDLFVVSHLLPLHSCMLCCGVVWCAVIRLILFQRTL